MIVVPRVGGGRSFGVGGDRSFGRAVVVFRAGRWAAWSSGPAVYTALGRSYGPIGAGNRELPVR